MKIFEIIYNDDEKQWVVANTNIEALKEVLSTEDADIDLMTEIKELPEDKWDEWHVTNTDCETGEEDLGSMTFREFLNECKHAQIISATFYES